MSNYLGRCNEEGCGFALFATAEDIRTGESLRDVKAGQACRVGNGIVGRCTGGHKVFPMKLVQGTYSAVHKCDSRCLNARGWSCTCSCGGANHGRGHAATIVTASSEEPPASKHIGEVGKHISGTATVVARKLIEGGNGSSTLYTFRTANNSVIKWFAPSYADPDYAVGQKVSFRAKVKAHQDWNGEAQTQVIYLEEKVAA